MSSVEEIRERLEAAGNPGPWEWRQFSKAFAARCFVVPEGWDGEEPPMPHYPAVVAEVQHGFATCDLIAYAPTDIAYLLERVEELEGALRGLMRENVGDELKPYVDLQHTGIDHREPYGESKPEECPLCRAREALQTEDDDA